MARRFSAFNKCVGVWAAMPLLTLLCPYAGAQSDSLAAFDKALEDVVARVTPAVVQIESDGPPQKDSYDIRMIPDPIPRG